MLKINETPVRTSRSFGINNIKLTDVEIPNEIKEFEGLTITGDTSKTEISIIDKPRLLSYTPNTDDIILNSSVMYHYKCDENIATKIIAIAIIVNFFAKVIIIQPFILNSCGYEIHL